MNKWPVLLLSLILIACNGEENEEEEEESGSFPVLSLIQSQVRNVDTSLNAIRKIVTVDGRSDTTVIRREQFRAEAKEFLDLPDIATKKYKGDYRESRQFDEMTQNIAFIYTAKDEDATVRSEQVIVDQSSGEGAVKTIFIDQHKNDGDSVVTKRMLWQMDQFFQINTIVTRKGQPEKLRVEKVIWNDPRPGSGGL